MSILWWTKCMICGCGLPTTNKILDCIMIFTETWPNSDVPDRAIKLLGRYVLRADRTAVDSSKTRDGGLCIHVNKTWCRDTAITMSHCSANLEYLMVKCWPFYLPREFTSTVVTAPYIPREDNTKIAMKELHTAISKQQTNQPWGSHYCCGWLQSLKLEDCTTQISPTCLLPH